jgi:hypothetical protein
VVDTLIYPGGENTELFSIVECEVIMNPTLMRIAMGIVVALAVAGALNYYNSVDEKNLQFQDPWRTYVIDIGPKRFHEVIAMVPTQDVVGYISDLPDSVPVWDSVWFLEAQYALAPRLVIPHQDAQRTDWVLGDFFKPVDLAQIERDNRLKLVRDFGSGIVLFRSL